MPQAGDFASLKAQYIISASLHHVLQSPGMKSLSCKRQFILSMFAITERGLLNCRSPFIWGKFTSE